MATDDTVGVNPTSEPNRNKGESGSTEISPLADPKPKARELGVEIGVDMNMPFTTPFRVEHPRSADEELFEMLKVDGEDFGPSVMQLKNMRQMDGQARALYRLIVLPIKAALSQSTFVPADDGEAEAEFITQVFDLPPSQGGMSVTKHRFMAQLLQALFDGFAAFEQVYWVPTFGPLKGKYTLQKLAHRPSETITFVTDKTGGFAGFRQRAYLNGETIDKHIKAQNAFYYAAQEEERKFYGTSLFQSAFYHYDKKMKMYYIAHLAAQRAAVGTRVGTVPLNATKAAKREFFQNLANLSVAQWMGMPEGFKVEILREGGTFDFLNYINHHNSQMSKSVLANFFDEGAKGGGSGDASLVNFAQPGDDMFVLMLRGIMDEIANAINHYIIPRLIDWNFKGGKYPTFTWAALTDEQKAIIAHSFDMLATAGQSLTVTPEFVRELEKKMADEMGLEIDWEEVDAREEEEKAAEEAMLQQQGGVDEFGNPIAAPKTPEDEAIDQFEAQAASLSRQEDDLLQLAKSLLDDSVEVELAARKVQTQKGVDKYGAPIGSTISDGPDAAEDKDGRPVTIERLMSLKKQLENARELGNTTLIQNIAETMSDEVRRYSAGKTPKEIRSVLGQLAPNVNHAKGKAVRENLA